MNLDQMKTYKRMLGYSNETISRISGVPVATVRKVMSGTTTARSSRGLWFSTSQISKMKYRLATKPRKPLSMPERSKLPFDIARQGLEIFL